MELGFLWIFIAAIAIAFVMAYISDIRNKRAARRYRSDYEQSLKTQEEILVLLRESVSLQAKANELLFAIHHSIERTNPGKE